MYCSIVVRAWPTISRGSVSRSAVHCEMTATRLVQMVQGDLLPGEYQRVARSGVESLLHALHRRVVLVGHDAVEVGEALLQRRLLAEADGRRGVHRLQRHRRVRCRTW